MRVAFDTNILVSFAIRLSVSFEQIFDHVVASGISWLLSRLLLVAKAGEINGSCRGAG